MIRLLIYFMAITIVFLLGLVIGLERESTEEHPVNNEQYFIETVSEQSSEQLWSKDIDEQPTIVASNDRLLQKLASTCEKVVLAFYNIVVDVLYQISKLFI